MLLERITWPDLLIILMAISRGRITQRGFTITLTDVKRASPIRQVAKIIIAEIPELFVPVIILLDTYPAFLTLPAHSINSKGINPAIPIQQAIPISLRG